MTEGNLEGTDQGTGTGESSQPAWMDQLPDNLKSNEMLAKNATIGDLSQTFLDLHGKSEKAIYLPEENATEDEKTAFYLKLGRPENVEGYQFEKVTLPDRFKGMENQMSADEKAFKEVAFKIGLNKTQAEQVYSWYFTRLSETDKSLTKLETDFQEDTKKQLHKLWGDKATENTELAMRAAAKIGEIAGVQEQFSQYIDTPGIGNDPIWIRVFAAIDQAMSEDTTGDTKIKLEGGEPKEGFERHPQTGEPILNFPSMEEK